MMKMKMDWIERIKLVAQLVFGFSDDAIDQTDWETYWETYGEDCTPMEAMETDFSYA